MYDRTGETHPMFGTTRTTEPIVKISGVNHPMYSKTIQLKL